MTFSKEERAERRQAEAVRAAAAQTQCNDYNEANGFEVKPALFRPAPGKYQGFNRRQRRDGTAKRWLDSQAVKADTKAKLIREFREAQEKARV